MRIYMSMDYNTIITDIVETISLDNETCRCGPWPKA